MSPTHVKRLNIRYRSPRLKIAGMVASLFLLALIGIGFAVSVVQIQAAVAAYIGGESIWSRSQLSAVIYFDRYASSGNPLDLKQARDWLSVPLSDRTARLAMEVESLDEEAAREGLIGGRNHVDDVGGMIWLVRNLSSIDEFRHAIVAWQNTDSGLLEISKIGDSLEMKWAMAQPDRAQIASLRQQLAVANEQLQLFALEFREAMGDAARWAAEVLSIASTVFLLFLASIAWQISSRLTRSVRRSAQNFRAIFEQAAVGIVQIDRQGKVLDVNETLGKILGYSKSQLLTMRYENLLYPEDLESGRKQQRAVVSGRADSYNYQQRLKHSSGSSLWARLTISVGHYQNKRTASYIVVLEDVSESHRLSEELSYQANHDELTGLINRRAFERHLESVWSQAQTEHSSHALCFVDLDQFKVVNDTSGHGAGDELLRQVAAIASDSLRESDVLARLGGDEFGVILRNLTPDAAMGIAEKLRVALENMSFTWEGRSHSVGCSIGVVPITADVADISTLLRAVDIACYVAKNQGRNRTYLSVADDTQVTEQRTEMDWLNRIQVALQENRFFLEAQLISPSVCSRTSLRYEVLVRLKDEGAKTVPPGAFLPAAERFGIAHKIDRWVINEVFGQLAAYPEHLEALDACHINLSGRSFDQPDFADFVIERLQHYEVSGSKICFELTEAAAMQNLAVVQSFMARLRDSKCSFALDDFGTGLSSFSYLRRLPVDYLKIDGSFVRDTASDQTDLAIIRAINAIGKTLNTKTIAEVVETGETLQLLKDSGVDYFQGYGLHRPCRFQDLLSGRVVTLESSR